MGFLSKFDAKRETAGKIYRDSQINGEKRVLIGDVNHEILKGLVENINEAIQMGLKSDKFLGKPFYLAIYEKYDLVLKKALIRFRNITSYRPYPEQDSIVFHVYPGGDVYLCWHLPHRSEMMNILRSAELFDPDYVKMIRRWENIQLEYFGFAKDSDGNWVENPLYRGDILMKKP